MSGYGLTCRSSVCSNKLDCFKIYSNFHIHERKRKKNIFSLDFVSLRKKINPRLVLLLRWVVSSIETYKSWNQPSFIPHRCYGTCLQLCTSELDMVSHELWICIYKPTQRWKSHMPSLGNTNLLY